MPRDKADTPNISSRTAPAPSPPRAYVPQLWRDTATRFTVCLLLALLLVLLAMEDRGPNWVPPSHPLLAILEVWREVAFSMGVLACILASHGVGPIMAKNSRRISRAAPRSPKYYVWTAWSVGVTQIASIVAAMAFLVVGILHHADGHFWRSLPPTVVLRGQTVAVDLPLLVASVFVFAAVSFGATFLVCSLARSRKWNLMSLVVILLLTVYDANPRLPSLVVAPYYDPGVHQFRGSHAAELITLLVWIAWALVFPFASRQVFERRNR
ncbi:MAG: hypothetical protein WA871_00305 [Candidatus Acidiferrales bacterium]